MAERSPRSPLTGRRLDFTAVARGTEGPVAQAAAQDAEMGEPTVGTPAADAGSDGATMVLQVSATPAAAAAPAEVSVAVRNAEIRRGITAIKAESQRQRTGLVQELLAENRKNLLAVKMKHRAAACAAAGGIPWPRQQNPSRHQVSSDAGPGAGPGAGSGLAVLGVAGSGVAGWGAISAVLKRPGTTEEGAWAAAAAAAGAAAAGGGGAAGAGGAGGGGRGGGGDMASAVPRTNPIKMAAVQNVPTFTTWIFLAKNEQIPDEQSLVGRRRLYYDAEKEETTVCSESEDEGTPSSQLKDFSAVQDALIWRTIQQQGDSGTVIEHLASSLNAQAEQIHVRHKELKEQYQEILEFLEKKKQQQEQALAGAETAEGKGNRGEAADSKVATGATAAAGAAETEVRTTDAGTGASGARGARGASGASGARGASGAGGAQESTAEGGTAQAAAAAVETGAGCADCLGSESEPESEPGSVGMELVWRKKRSNAGGWEGGIGSGCCRRKARLAGSS
ncbi:hypothetical protein CLOP_g14784 [Closterium sp. NIES-67]|nr:hypothetical protein CLOP_g14784 [Closterium sp. NIES-67]